MLQRLALLVSFLGWTVVNVSAQPGATTSETETLLKGDIDSGFLFAPDFKFTDVNGDFASLAGGYGGFVINRKLLIGGGAYTLLDGARSTDMTYGGGVIEYFVNPGSLVNLSVRGLVGGGSATLGRRSLGLDFGDDFEDLPSIFGGRNGRRGGRIPVPGFPPGLDAASTSFFVAEPEANLTLNVTEKIRLGFGGGYRFIGGAGRLGNALDGFVASASLKLAFF